MNPYCTGRTVPADKLHGMLGDGPYGVGERHNGLNGHNILILKDGTGQHAECHPEASGLGRCVKGIGTSPVWIAIALLAAGTVIGILGILGKLPLGPVGSPLLTALAGACFLGSLVNMVRQHGLPCRPVGG